MTEDIDFKADDFEIQPRILGRNVNFIVSILMVTLSLFQLYTAWRGPLIDLLQRSIHLLFILQVAFIIYPASKTGKQSSKLTVVDFVFILLATASLFWVCINFE